MIVLSILAFIFCIIQISILRSIAILQVIPDIVLIIVIYVALFHGKIAMWFGFFTGFFIDLYSSKLGYSALINTVIGYGIGNFASQFSREVPVLWVIMLFGGSLFQKMVLFAVQKELSLFFFGRYVILGSLYTTVVGVIIFFILRKIEQGKK
ncbi:rod shape-determining protein MreD [candidate division WOR-3 bacterium]|nr:rod shape-determining protein MreD [candidate division WOR-3 bacterium]